MRDELQEIKRHIYEDGSISESEVALLKAVFARYGMGEEEVGLLLDLNTVLSGESHAAGFDQLLIDGVVTFMTGEGSAEAKLSWLKSRLLKDGTVDDLERKALAACAAKGVALSDDLKAFL